LGKKVGWISDSASTEQAHWWMRCRLSTLQQKGEFRLPDLVALGVGKSRRSGLAIQQLIHCDNFMARPLRIELAGGFYHVTSRGDRREDISRCEMDRCFSAFIMCYVLCKPGFETKVKEADV